MIYERYVDQMQSRCWAENISSLFSLWSYHKNLILNHLSHWVHSSTFSFVHEIAWTLLEHKQWSCSGCEGFSGLDEHIWQGLLSMAIMFHPKTTNLFYFLFLWNPTKITRKKWMRSIPTKASQVIKIILSRIYYSEGFANLTPHYAS